VIFQFEGSCPGYDPFISAGVGSFVVSPFLKRSTKIWYQMASFDHFGTERRDVFSAFGLQLAIHKTRIAENKINLIDFIF
jgi:hypothetical protein